MTRDRWKDVCFVSVKLCSQKIEFVTPKIRFSWIYPGWMMQTLISSVVFLWQALCISPCHLFICRHNNNLAGVLLRRSNSSSTGAPIAGVPLRLSGKKELPHEQMVYEAVLATKLGLFGGGGWADAANAGMFVSTTMTCQR
jgi:hypothetical protein